MAGSYKDIAGVIAELRATLGGTDAQRQATADLIKAFYHFEFVELARDLKRQDIDASVRDGVSDTAISVEGRFVSVLRFSAQYELTIEFVGFDAAVIQGEQRRQTTTCGAASIETTLQNVRAGVHAIGEMIRRDIAIRASQRTGK